MSDERRKHGWPFWCVIAAIALPILYVASFGPACYLVDRGIVAARPVGKFYRPIVPVVWRLHSVASAYAGLCGARAQHWTVTRICDAAKPVSKAIGDWPADMHHETPLPSDKKF